MFLSNYNSARKVTTSIAEKSIYFLQTYYDEYYILRNLKRIFFIFKNISSTYKEIYFNEWLLEFFMEFYAKINFKTGEKKKKLRTYCSSLNGRLFIKINRGNCTSHDKWSLRVVNFVEKKKAFYTDRN